MLTFREITLDDAQTLLTWRSQESIAHYMISEISTDLSQQQNWLASVYNRPDYYHWIIEYEQQPVGVINLSNFSIESASLYMGFYIAESSAKGLGAMVPVYFYNFVFSQFNVTSVRVEVMYHNTAVIDLHLLHGYQFEPSRDRVVEKQGKPVLLISMQLTREGFNTKRYRKCIADFPIEHWKGYQLNQIVSEKL